MPKHACTKCGALYEGLGGGTCETCHFGTVRRQSNRGLMIVCAVAAAVVLVLFIYARLTH